MASPPARVARASKTTGATSVAKNATCPSAKTKFRAIAVKTVEHIGFPARIPGPHVFSGMAQNHRRTVFDFERADSIVNAGHQHGPGHRADPSGFAQSVRAFADGNGVRRPVRNLAHADVTVAKEEAIAVNAGFRVSKHSDIVGGRNIADLRLRRVVFERRPGRRRGSDAHR